MRIVLVAVAALWGAAAVLAFAGTADKTADARLTAAYIIAWPVVALALVLNEPVPMWIAVPVMFGFIPWVLAGPHLWEILRDPSMIRSDEIIGIPRDYWFWGGIGAVLLGILFSGYSA